MTGPADLSRSQLERFQRHLSLEGFGPEAQGRLLAARVLVIGAGGLGSPVLTYLAAAGVGTIDVVDHDVVDRSNLHRQVIHTEERVGAPKTASAAQVMRGLHPEIRINEHRRALTAENALALMEPADLVVDGSDNFATRYIVADAAEIAGKPVVHGAILRFHGQVGVFWSGRGPGYRDLYPEPPDPGEVPTCAEAGVLGVLPGVIGTLMATEAIKMLTGVGEPLLGRVLHYDALSASFREIRVRPDPEREPVTVIGADVPVPGPDGVACEPGVGQAAGGTDEGEGREISVAELRRRLAAGERVTLVDVREDWEHRLAAIPGSVSIPVGEIVDGAEVPGVAEADASGSIVLYCKAGTRSLRALEALEARHPGAALLSLSGGHDAWAQGHSEE